MSIEVKPIDLPDGELIVWAQLAPFGEHPGMRDGQPITQLCDRKAFEQVIAAFEPEVLMDFEHRSENTDDTSASAWVQKLRISDTDGLEGLLRMTKDGAEAIRTRRLRYPSVVWPLDGQNRPRFLKSVALTNTPNLDCRPILNKGPSGEDLRPVLNKAPGGEPQERKPNMKKLAALYGLPETATEDEILAAAKAATDKLTALESRVAEMEKASLTAEAGAVADKNPNKVCNKAEFVKLYVQNKDMALALLATVRESKPVCNKSDAKKPEDIFGTPVQNKLTEYEKMPEGKPKRQFLRDNAEEINALRVTRDSAQTE